MPNISWEEIRDLKHVLQEAESKMVKNAKYLRGLIDLIDSVVGKYEDQ